MDKIELKKRTKKFAVDIIVFLGQLPYTKATDIISKQLLRSATSVGANYRSACRGKSAADFINKIIIVEEEADESVYWLELLEEASLVNVELTYPLKKEANELTAIFTSIGKTSKLNQIVLNPKSKFSNSK
ncbi:MAG TPA: four helix bundle protein [Sphingobacteriaceae bacterium]|nr:four helix bundle protein [Sphingobacteriaceae bacterium]